MLRVVGACALLLAVAVLAANLRDEEPSAQAREYAQSAAQSAVQDASEAGSRGNAFHALLGLDAAPDADAVETGRLRAAEHNRLAAQDPTSRELQAGFAGLPADDASPDGLLRWQGGERLRHGQDASLLAYASRRTAFVQAALAQNAVVVARYQAMLDLPAFVNTLSPSRAVPLLSLGPLGLAAQAHWVLLLQAAIDAQAGRADAACGFLARDLAFWRRVTGGHGELVNVLQAVDFLAGDLAFAGEILALPDLDAAACVLPLRAALAPWEAPERSLRAAFAMELEQMQALVPGDDPAPAGAAASDAGAAANGLAQAVAQFARAASFQRQATLNLAAQAFARYEAESAHTPRVYREQDRPAQEAAWAANGTPWPWEWAWAYNYAGRQSLAGGMLFYEEAVARTMDLAALTALVRAQLELRASHARWGELPGRLEGLPVAARDPYTERAFAWDSARHRLSFEPLSVRARGWATCVTVVGD